MTHVLTGSCHCGALHFTFETPTSPETLPLRACDCSFCRKHGARSTSDPAGRVHLVADDPSALLRYRFGTRTAEILICGKCGIYVAATASVDDALYAVININTLDDRTPFDRVAEVTNRDHEDAAQRASRRRATWIPATLDVAAPAR
jgi:hypothetical protein